MFINVVYIYVDVIDLIYVNKRLTFVTEKIIRI